MTQFPFMPEKLPVHHIAAHVDAAGDIGLEHPYRVVMYDLAKAFLLAESM
jgi:hypothetical protein